MATSKSGGIVGKVKRAVSNLFSSEPEKPEKKATAAKKAPAKKGPAKKSPAKKALAKKAAGKPSTPATKSATSMDRKLIALSEPYEVRDWCKSLGCSEAELKAAVKAVGNSAAKVRAHLKR